MYFGTNCLLYFYWQTNKNPPVLNDWVDWRYGTRWQKQLLETMIPSNVTHISHVSTENVHSANLLVFVHFRATPQPDRGNNHFAVSF